MKKIKEIKRFNNLGVYKNSIIVYNKDECGLLYLNEELEPTLLINESIHKARVFEDNLIYQNNFRNLVNWDKKVEIQNNNGYELLTALKYNNYIYIYSGDEDAELFFNFNLEIIGNAPRYCCFSYKDYLFDKDKSSLICYNLNDKLWDYKRDNDSDIQIISGYKNKILVYSESGDLFALSLENGEVCWKYPEKTFHTNSLCKDCLYTQDKNNLIEIDAESGKKIRAVDVKTIETKEKFIANRIKVYDDYIFCIDTFGTFAIFDRKTLTLKEIIRLDEHMINRDYALQWLNNRLYIQTIGGTIHIFEDIV